MRLEAVTDTSRNNSISELSEITKKYYKDGLQMGK